LVCGKKKKKTQKLKFFSTFLENIIISVKAAAVAKGSRVIILLFVEKRLKFSIYYLFIIFERKKKVYREGKLRNHLKYSIVFGT
jgi:hypothetical protein